MYQIAKFLNGSEGEF